MKSQLFLLMMSFLVELEGCFGFCIFKFFYFFKFSIFFVFE